MKRKYLYIALAVVAVAALVYVAVRAEAVPVEVQQPVVRDVAAFSSEEATVRLGEDYTIDMPVSGRLERVVLEVGDLVEEGEVLARIEALPLAAQVEALRAAQAQARAQIEGVESDILSEEVVEVEEGDRVEISGEALQGETVVGEVARVYPSAFTKISALGIEQQRVKVLISYAHEAYPLRPGTRVEVRIITDMARDTLAIPERTLFRAEGEWMVFVAEGGEAELRPVAVGIRNSDWAAIEAGLEPEVWVILDPPNDLEPGAKVDGEKS